MIREKICEFATVRLLAPGVVENIIHDNVALDVQEIKELKEINKELTEGGTYAVLVNSGMFTSITKEARELTASSQFQQKTIAKALLVPSLGHRLVGRFYITVNKPHITTRIFSPSDRDKAISWLQELVDGVEER